MPHKSDVKDAINITISLSNDGLGVGSGGPCKSVTILLSLPDTFISPISPQGFYYNKAGFICLKIKCLISNTCMKYIRPFAYLFKYLDLVNIAAMSL